MVKRINNGNNVLPPTKAGQIPVAEPNSNGRLVYNPTSVSLPSPQAADAGKVLAINAVTANGVTYKYENLTTVDPMLLSYFNQNGVLLTLPGSLTTTFGGKNLAVAANNNVTAVFYDPASGVRTTKNINAGTIAITTTGDSTYVFINPDGTYGQVHSSTDPADFKTVNYLFKVYHPEGGDIVGVKYIYTILSNPQEGLRNYGYAQGIIAQNFHFQLLNTSTGTLGQQSNYAVVSGYNINPSDNMPSQRIFPKTTNTVGITFDYWSWNPADRLKAQTNAFLGYKYDVPQSGTSVTVSSGYFSVMLLYAGSDGSYILLAPQTIYNTAQAAQEDLFSYLSYVTLPQLILEQYDCVAAIIFAPAAPPNTYVINLNSIGVSGTAKADLLPAPSTAGVVKVMPGTNAYSIQPDTPTPAVDLTGFVDGDILGVVNGKIAPVKPNVIFPVAGYKNAKVGRFRVVGTTISHTSLALVNSGITLAVSTLTGGFQQIVFGGVTNFWLHGGTYLDKNGQHHFKPQIPNSTSSGLPPPENAFINSLRFLSTYPRTFDDNTQGFEFLIYFFLL